MTRIKDGIIHLHTDNSKQDGFQSVAAAVKRAKELGASAVTLTDHGVMTGIYEFISECEKAGIKPIPGVETYKEDDDSNIGRCHLLLLPKNYEGLIAIGKAVTASNTRLQGGFPRMDDEILKKYFGPGSKGYGNVIATSACAGGVLARVLLFNDKVANEIQKIQKKISELRAHDSGYEKLQNDFYEAELKLKEAEEHLAQATEISKKSIRGIRSRFEKMKSDDSDYEKLKKIIEEYDQAVSDKVTYKMLKKQYQNVVSEAKKRLTPYLVDDEKRTEFEQALSELDSQIIDKDTLHKRTKDEAKKYVGIFGKGNFYIELQYHGIEEEGYVYPLLAEIAEEMGIPVVAANDAHYTYKSEDEVIARQINRSLRFNKWEDFRPDDWEYYIKDDEELREALLKILKPDIVEKAMSGIGMITAQCDVHIPAATHYPKYKSDIDGEDAAVRLNRLARAGISKRYPEWTEELEKRYQYEMGIITSMGFADYLCIVQDYMDFARKEGKNNPEGVGLAVGPGRGSAAGSLICYLTGITDVDPIRFNLLFERFLNPERVSMPDIDCDFANFIRPKAIEYVKSKYGENAVCAISTRMTQGAKAAVRNAARIYGTKVTGAKETFLGKGDEIAKKLTPEFLNDGKGKPQPLKKVKEKLFEEYQDDENARTIIEWASLIEGSIAGFGMHAAGIIISDNDDVSDYMPLMYNTKKEQWVAQCDMVQAEGQLKTLKMDFLGLKNLDVITDTLRLIKKNTGKAIDCLKISLDDREVFDNIFSKGRTNCVFQFESPGMKDMLRRFRPTSIDDVILLVAAYRPGPMQFLDNIIKVKTMEQKAKYLTPELEPILKGTYSAIIYQEQVQEIFRELAGYTLGQADIVRRAMSKKKTAVMEEHRDYFVNGKTDEKGNVLIDGCVRRGIPADIANQLYDQISDFAAYAFNRSHAACYGILSYYTAWLKYHYPTEYMVAVIKHTPNDKLGMLIDECHSIGIKVLPPDVNKSEKDFSGRDKVILFGFSAIKGVANSADDLIAERSENGYFIDFKSFVKRAGLKINVFEALIDTGACDLWNKNRNALKAVLPVLLDCIKKINKKETDIAEINRLIGSSRTAAEKTKQEARLERAKKTLANHMADYAGISIPSFYEEDRLLKLNRERELIGFYVSGHPLDMYTTATSKITRINDVDPGFNKEIAGIITDYKVMIIRQSKEEMAIFNLIDQSGTVECLVFPKTYQSMIGILGEGKVVKLSGKIKFEELVAHSEEEQYSEEGIIVKKLFVQSGKELEEDKKEIIMEVPNLIKWTQDILPKVKRFINDKGNILKIFDSLTGHVRDTGLNVSADILTGPFRIITR